MHQPEEMSKCRARDSEDEESDEDEEQQEDSDEDRDWRPNAATEGGDATGKSPRKKTRIIEAKPLHYDRTKVHDLFSLSSLSLVSGSESSAPSDALSGPRLQAGPVRIASGSCRIHR